MNNKKVKICHKLKIDPRTWILFSTNEKKKIDRTNLERRL